MVLKVDLIGSAAALIGLYLNATIKCLVISRIDYLTLTFIIIEKANLLYFELNIIIYINI